MAVYASLGNLGLSQARIYTRILSPFHGQPVSTVSNTTILSKENFTISLLINFYILRLRVTTPPGQKYPISVKVDLFDK